MGLVILVAVAPGCLAIITATFVTSEKRACTECAAYTPGLTIQIEDGKVGAPAR